MPIVAILGCQRRVASIVTKFGDRHVLPHIKEQVARVVAELRDKTAAAGIKFLIGGIDLSVNCTTAAPATAKYQLHLWSIGVETDIRQAEAELRKLFPSSEAARTRVRVQRIDGDPRAYAYAMKNSFSRRISLPPSSSSSPDAAGAASRVAKRANTRNKPLTAAQRAEVALILDVLGADRRLFRRGAEIDTRRDRKVLRPALNLSHHMTAVCSGEALITATAQK